MMAMLMRKDWRVYRSAIIGGVILLPVYYLISLYTEVVWFDPLFLVGQPSEVRFYQGLYLTAIIAAVFGGLSFATERRDRSAQFLYMLPQSRGRIVLSKLLVALGCIGVLILVNIAIMAAHAAYWTWSIPNWPPSSEIRLVLMSTRLEMALPFATFSIAWMLGRFTPSPAIAASTSIGVTMGAVFLMHDIIWQAGYRRADAAWGARCAIIAGAIALLVGTIHYLRRVEP